MYEVEALLSIVVAHAYVQGVLRGRTPWTVALVPALAAMVYVHNWALFLCVGLAARDGALRAPEAEAVRARRSRRRAALPAVGADRPVAGAAHRRTMVDGAGLPRSRARARSGASTATRCSVALVLVGGGGLLALARRRDDDERTIVLALAAVIAVTVVLAWLSSQFSPAWTTRYFAVVLGPVLLVGSRGLARARSARPRRSRGDPVPVGRLLGARRQGERAADHRGRLAVHASRRARRLDPSRAGAGASLLPRPRLPLRNDDGAGARRPGLRLAQCRRPAASVEHAGPRSTRRSQRCRPGASSWSWRRCSATTVRGMPPGRISSGRSRPRTPRRSSRIRVFACSSTSRPTRSRFVTTTSSRCRRSSIAESARFRGRGRLARPIS